MDNKRDGNQKPIEEIMWTDAGSDATYTLRGIVPLPTGYVGGICPKCKSTNIHGAIITPSSDEQDPNIICLDCGYWHD